MMKKRSILVWLIFVVYVSSAAGQQRGLPEMLRPLNGGLQVSIQQYEGSALRNTRLFHNNELTDGENTWQLAWKTAKAADGRSCDVTLTCKLVKGRAAATALSVAFAFGQWDVRNYVMVPGIVYNGNRYRAIGNGYNPDYPKDMYFNPAVPLTISNNPRLSLSANDSSFLELSTTNTAAPAMSFYSPAAGKSWMVLTEQGTRWGNSGLFIQENNRRDSCIFRISAPAMRNRAAGFGDFHRSGDKAPDWNEGDEMVLRFRVYVSDADGIPGHLQQFMHARKSVTGPNQPRNLVPMSKLVQLGTDICRDNFAETTAGKYYLPENSRHFQLGWVSGMINTFPMLALNDATERRRVAEELDFITSRMQGKSGYFYGFISAEGKLGTEKAHPDFPALQAMVRKNGDVLFWLMKHLLLLKAQGHGHIIKPEWETAARKLAGAFTTTWKKYGEFGQYILPETGEIAVFNSTAGAIAPAGLALAADYFRQPEWMTIAEAAAAHYYQRDVEQQGFTSGACGDISQDADSETAFGFLESLMALYNYTGKPVWLARAKVQAALCSSWALAYDPVFPPGSTIAKLGGRMTGAIWASSQNKHAAPGVCTSSADHLFKLYRATGDEQYAELIRDMQHAHTEAVNMPGHITTNYLIGSSMERIQPSDAEGKGAIGNFIHTRNSWTETNGILMAMELPGIYVRPGEGKMYVFDHIGVARVAEDRVSVTLRLTNRTPYAAAVSVFAENARKASQPLGYTAFLRWPKVNVPAGGELTVRITADGKVTLQPAADNHR
ncbi:hypothetical protein EGT74_24220 [Chitinophaga lutea]|uniref:Uncharacterized protein n=1 Tax=Chitinophaga lutea TaxID=2488634 RepID=A0A3N4Q164_9BACT|nr:hypothetical protein [Chitinophaga lutea]RPE05494.1 hypothetical protein EGT74_24220 [Chitinophaga lutea]